MLTLASPAEKRARDAVTHEAWGQRLSVAEYGAREERLRAHPWAKAGMRTWLWHDEGDVVASLETFGARGLVDGHEGAMELLASVYTEPRHRRRGYATRLMDAVVARLAEEGRTRAVVLYSDVGEAQYARSGFVTLPSLEWTWPAEPRDVDVVAITEVDVRSLDVSPPRAAFAIAPTGLELDWHVERERIYREVLGAPALASHGARRGGALAVWSADWKASLLRVLVATPGEGLAACLDAATDVAARAGLPRVSLWASPALETHVPFAPTPRDGSLTMVHGLGVELGVEPAFVPRAAWV